MKTNRPNNSKKIIFKVERDIKNFSNSKESFLGLEQKSKKLFGSKEANKLNLRTSESLSVFVPSTKPPRVKNYDQNKYSGGYGFKNSRNSSRGGGINFIL